jgi:hypothetical protein
MRQCQVPKRRLLVDPLDVVEQIRWEILEANRNQEHLWDRLAHLGEALDLVVALEAALEDAIRATALDLRTWGGGEGEELVGGA